MTWAGGSGKEEMTGVPDELQDGVSGLLLDPGLNMSQLEAAGPDVVHQHLVRSHGEDT